MIDNFKKYDFYNPAIHKGDLPVRVLSHNYLDWFENITPEFKDEVLAELNFNDLKRGIKYHSEREKITECAAINDDRQIELYQNFNQYLWCISYSLLVLFDEAYVKPIINEKFTGKLDFNNSFIKRAVGVFENGFDLLHTFKDWQFYTLPNPEKYNKFEKFYIEKSNSGFTAAMTFILLHEFAHQYYDHLSYTPTEIESIRDEYVADDFAIDKMASKINSDDGFTYKFGIVSGLCSLTFLDKTMSGGGTHPDPDERLISALNSLNLSDTDHLWGIASFAFILWAFKYDASLDLPGEFENFKELLGIIYSKLQVLKYT